MLSLLETDAARRPDFPQFTFLSDGEGAGAELTLGTLAQRARALAARLQEAGACGERAILLFPPGLTFIHAFFGCLYAGVVAVPCYPPSSRRRDPRLAAVSRDARPGFVLTTAHLLARRETVEAQVPELAGSAWLAVDEVPLADAALWRPFSPEPEDLAFLQYSSGSTGDPKGVMVTHGNLLHNEELIRRAFGQSAESVIVGWLPLYHDMGLIGNVLQPLYVGARAILMPPLAFLQQPARWLQAISTFRATTSGGPNFAYDLCVRKVSEEAKSKLDLSSWKVAFNGAEPVRGSTLAEFSRAFAPCGFDSRAFYPCYGLAEATLFVAGGVAGAGAVVRDFDAAALAAGEAAPCPRAARRMVGCGRAWGDLDLQVVDTESLLTMADGREGEIWVRGPSTALGYFDRPEESASTFGARLATGEGPYLRTGDLGFLAEGELFVTGRLKDLLIIRGRNIHPQDLERTAEESHPALQPGGSAAFSVEEGGEERAVLVAELSRTANSPLAEVAAAVRRSLAAEHEVQLFALAFIRTGTLPKTSSGKVRRRACRAAYLAGGLEEVGRVDLAAEEVAVSETSAEEDELTAWLRGAVASACRVPMAAIRTDRPLIDVGLDSLAGVELQQALDERLGVAVSLPSLLRGRSLAELAQELRRAELRPAQDESPAAQGSFPLSVGQRALWFLDRLSPECAVYTLAGAAKISGLLGRDAFGLAVGDLVARHAALRLRFMVEDDRPMQAAMAEVPTAAVLEIVDAASWSAEQALADLDRAARTPFALETGPPLRLRLLVRGPLEHWLLLAVHHLVADLWSLVVMLRDLETLYRARLAGHPAELPAPASDYAEHVRRQEELLAGERGAILARFWQGRSAVFAPALELPLDHPRPVSPSYRGDAVPFALSSPVVSRLRDLARAGGATVFVALLACFASLLARLSGQRRVVVGTPTSGRGTAERRHAVGYFVNPVVVGADFSGSLTFRSLLAALREEVLAALEHQDYPFALLADHLEGERDASRAPIFQVMFLLHRVQEASLARLASFALGETGAALPWAGLKLASLRLPSRPAAFDLSLCLTEDGEEVRGTLEFACALFDRTTAERWSRQLALLAAAMTLAPDRPVASFSLLAAAQERQALREWNDAAASLLEEIPVHRAIERAARTYPEEAALVMGEELLRYRELNARSNRLARLLEARGVSAGARVGIALERSLDMVVAMLAALKAGAAYVPLDLAYPQARLKLVLADAGVSVLVVHESGARRLRSAGIPLVVLEKVREELAHLSSADPPADAAAGSLAYLIYTSGSTGRPKGVMVPHAAVASFFAAMDERLGRHRGTWLAVTSISFDISVLELLWTLARGFKVILRSPAAARPALASRSAVAGRSLDLSLFYFASDAGAGGAGNPYRLLLEGARFGDAHGFAAVWTPERHFHAFGGLYPNPAVTGAAVAAVTERIGIRAGSVVLPLHHPVRVVEEWSVVDNLSGGRVGLSLASGWNAADFVFAPERYARRKEEMAQGIDRVRRLWRGERVRFPGGAGEVEIVTLPRPVQRELPLWLTAAGSPETFRHAGELGLNVLTHLLGQSLLDLAEKVAVYRRAWREAGHPGSGKVALMLHTFLAPTAIEAREAVREPFTTYLASSVDLMKALAPGQDLSEFTEADRAALLARAFERYFETSGLFGTADSCLARLDELSELGVDEVACLIDFGVGEDEVFASLELLAEMRRALLPGTLESDRSAAETLPSLVLRHGVTHLQLTPSAAQAFLAEDKAAEALGKLEVMMVGGEALPAALAARLLAHLGGALLNMYGPTETTIWSAVARIDDEGKPITLGRPIANTELAVVDRRGELLPAGQPGELFVGGLGVVRGYHARPGLTAERFVPDPWSGREGARLYRTGDLVRLGAEGRPSFLGRLDFQVKLRGHRIELGEVEAALTRHSTVAEAVVTLREDAPGDPRLVAYVVPQAPLPDLGSRVTPEKLARVLAGGRRHRLPNDLWVAHLSAEQTSAIYREIFEQEIYLQRGVTLPEDACVFDVGANIGLFTLFVGSRCRWARILAFEPIPPTHGVLRANVELYDLPAEVFEIGVSDREEEAEFTFYPQMSGLSTRFADDDEEVTRAVVETWLARGGGAGRPGSDEVRAAVAEMLASETHRCRLRPLSAVIAERGIERIDLLKVDVEKSEIAVLRGVADADWPKVRQVVLEVHSRELLAETERILSRQGFELHVDELMPVGELGEAVWMVYALRPELSRSAAATAVSVPELAAHLASVLPAHMCPSDYVLLERLPQTPNGKVDRMALAAPERRRAVPARAHVAPQGELQETLAAVWRELLRVDQIGIHDNFFEAGGNSLLLVEAHGRLNRVLGQEVALVDLMRHPTVARLAAWLEARTEIGAGLLPLTAGEWGAERPLSFFQQRLWLFETFYPGTPVYHVAVALALAGELDVRALVGAVAGVARRNDLLSSRLGGRAGEPRWVAELLPQMALPVVDLGGLGDEGGAAAKAALRSLGACRPFDLSRAPLLRSLLLRLRPRRHELLLTVHHLVADAGSLEVFFGQLERAYDGALGGRALEAPSLRRSFADYAAWQARNLAQGRFERASRFWSRELDGASGLELPIDRPRPAVPGLRGSWIERRCSPRLWPRIEAMARRRGATPFVVLLSATVLLLERWTGMAEVVLGMPVAERDLLPGEEIVGPMINLLLVRSSTSGVPHFEALVDRLRAQVLAATEHRHVPFEVLSERWRDEGSAAASELVRATFAMAPSLPSVQLAGIEVTPQPLHTGTSKFDLSLFGAAEPSGWVLSAEFRDELFDRTTLVRLLAQLERLLEAALAGARRPLREISALGPAERSQLLLELGLGFAPSGEAAVPDRVLAQARLAPHRVAVREAGRQLSYGSLVAAAWVLAGRLSREYGVGVESRVGLLLPRRTVLPVAALATVLTGGAYVALEPTLPSARLRSMVGLAACAVVLTTSRLALALSEGGDFAGTPIAACEPTGAAREVEAQPRPVAWMVSPEQLAYAVFTSGSTGTPKPVGVPHRGLSNLVAWHLRQYSLGAEDRCSHLAGLGFDASAWELWPPLAAGAAVCLAPDDVPTRPRQLIAWLEAERVTVSFLPTPLAEDVVAESGAPQLELRFLLTGGDRLRRSAPAASAWRLVNHYGPTEASVVATAGPVPRRASAAAPTIGRPIAGLAVYVLDRHLRPVALGAPGELWIAGPALARGYLGRPASTAERFLPAPQGAAGDRLYRSGDVARLRADGEVEFIGRRDEQVKLRGHRIELGEVEAALLELDGVADAAALLSGLDAGARLVAFVVREHDGGELDLHAALARRLPAYMLPSTYVERQALPRTPSGKVDRRALARIDLGSGERRAFVAPRTEVEATMAALWRDVLEVEQVGILDDFFQLGGHSLRAARVLAQVRDRFGVEVPPGELFREPTIAGLTRALARALVAASAAPCAAPGSLSARSREGQGRAVPEP